MEHLHLSRNYEEVGISWIGGGWWYCKMDLEGGGCCCRIGMVAIFAGLAEI